jgi:hypothetical protein
MPQPEPGFFDFVSAAFNARPIGMFVAPNWIGLGVFAMLGFVNPGFWVLGAGLELGYLSTLAMNPRFQRMVTASRLSDQNRDWQGRVDALLARLDADDRRRFAALQSRCQAVLDQHAGSPEWRVGDEPQRASLGRVTWMYLGLLVTRTNIERVLQESRVSDSEAGDLRRRIADRNLGEDLRRSLQGQLEILEARLVKRREAGEKLAFLDAELKRIEQQVELVREQAALATDPESLSHRIDEITSTLGGTAQWVRDQQQIYGAMEDLLTEAPPLPATARELE